METKTLPIGFELKSVTGRTIEGYAAAWAKDRVNDIISSTAFDRTIQANPDVAIFVGHDSTKLPVGHPIEMRADSHGLFTKSHIYDTPDGNALLTVARERLAKGRTLGMSIGFRTVKDHWDAKQKARILEDVDLIEYSFLASPLLAANPQAVAIGVKATSLVEGSYEDMQGDLRMAASALLGGYCCVCATYPDHVIVMADALGADSSASGESTYWDIPYTLDKDGEPVLGEAKPVQAAFVDGAAKARGDAALKEHKATMGADARNPAKGGSLLELDDTAFAYIDSGGMLDQEQKTVPRSHRHVPHHHADGTPDLDAVKAFLEAPGDEHKALGHMMEHAWDAGMFGLKSHTSSSDRTTGASRSLLEVAYRLLMLADRTAEDRWAMKRGDLDPRDGARLYKPAQAELKAITDLLNQTLQRAQEIDRGEDGAALTDMFRTAFELLDLEEVA